MTPSTSKCKNCEYGCMSVGTANGVLPCACPCHTTHNQEEGVIVRDLTIDILPQYKVERLGTLQEAVEEIKEEWEKSCTQCGVFKPLAEFYRKSTSLDGYNYYCKQCYLKYDASRYYGNKGKRLEKDRARYHRDKTSSIESKKRQKEKYPEKEKARQAVRNAIYLGKIKRLPCVKCGDEKSHAHHEDYKKPFDVVWLCRKHHMELHRKYERVS